MRLLFSRPVRLVVFAAWWLSLPWLLLGAKRAWDSNQNRIEDWLPDSFEETQSLIWFFEHFGTDELLMIGWEGCDFDDPRLEALREQLLAPTDDATSEPYFRNVFTGPTVLAELQAPPLDLSRREALRKMRGWLTDPEGRTTCAVALVSTRRMHDRRGAVAHVLESADRVEGLSRETIHLAGPTLESVAIDEASKQGLVGLNALSFLVCLVILLICMRSPRIAIVVFAMALYNEQFSMALVYYTGQNMDSVLLLMANVTYVISISAGVHFANYYRDARSHGITPQPAVQALRDALRPTLIAATTTAIGFASLATSRIVPINRFGLYAAISVLWAITAIPIAAMCLYTWTGRAKTGGTGLGNRAKANRPERNRPETPRFSDFLVRFIQRMNLPVQLAAIVLLVVGGMGVRYVQTSLQLHDLFLEDARIVRDYEWLEENIGGLVPIEIVLEIPRRTDRSVLEQLMLARHVAKSVAEHEDVDATVSAVTFSPRLLPAGRLTARDVARKVILSRALEQREQRFIDLHYLCRTDDVSLWRINAHVAAGARIDYVQFIAELRERVERALAESPDTTFRLCGGMPLIYRAQAQLLEDLIRSFLYAFLLIALVLMVLFRSVTAGLLAMIPNVLPGVVVFGTMGWLGWKVEIGSMMTASAALGIAVDDSLHFIIWFRRAASEGKTLPEAVAHAYRRCGVAMIQTTLICALGLAVFSLSPFMPIARFAWLMAALLSAALFCDLIVLPAIIIGPLGKHFLPKENRVARVQRDPRADR